MRLRRRPVLVVAFWVVRVACGDAVDWREADARGNRLPDFSHCGYRASESAIPTALVRVIVEPREGDDGGRIQAALDHVSSLDVDGNGLRGAVLLAPGRFEVEGQLRFDASGVVLRGSGRGASGTELVATGPGRRTLLRVRGGELSTDSVAIDSAVEVADDHVPVGARTLRVSSVHGLEAGDRVFIVRPSTEDWVEALGMKAFGVGWRAGSRDLRWDRTIVSVYENTLRFDAPLTTSLERRFGGGRVIEYRWSARIENIGIENLRLVSRSDLGIQKSESHSWVAISVENCADAWVRQVDFVGFAGGAVYLWETTKRITVEDCLSTSPVSEIGGARRRTFHTTGQQNLFQRCWSDSGIEDFTVGHCAAGPNAFVSCTASRTNGDSGSIGSWASGTLFDNVRIDGGGLRLDNLWSLNRGAGWASANSVLWQCSAAEIRCFDPPTAVNWAFGVWARFTGDGHFRDRNDFVSPRSLFAAQLEARVGPEVAALRGPAVEYPRGTTNPRLEEAQEMVAASSVRAPTVRDLILDAPRRQPIPTARGDAPTIEALRRDVVPGEASRSAIRSRRELAVTNGWLTIEGALAIGRIYHPTWWRGNTRPAERKQYGHAITRFVPGRDGQGFTDELDEVASHLVDEGYAGLEHHHGLWYDRRRDDHQRVRRRDGAVEPPFYEQPFQRSGRGTAWDGLSLYDLTRFEPWYWSRLDDFAGLCDQRGLVFLGQHYFQHNVLEAGAHWSDSPWRTANNVNDTGFPEPPSYAGDKRIFFAHLFYDVSHATRRELHRGYIRQCLESLSERSNVLHLTGAEFTGPLAFVQFWIDSVVEWETETGRDALLVLSATKDVQDAILADERRASAVSVVDIRYWWYEADGDLYAPEGGKNLAPRQFQRLRKPRRSSFEQTVRAIREVRRRAPDAAIITNVDAFDPWAVVMAGGSLPRLASLPASVRLAIPGLRLDDDLVEGEACYALAREGREALVLSRGEVPLVVDLRRWSGAVSARWVDPGSGEFSGAFELEGGTRVTLDSSRRRPAILWLETKR